MKGFRKLTKIEMSSKDKKQLTESDKDKKKKN